MNINKSNTFTENSSIYLGLSKLAGLWFALFAPVVFVIIGYLIPFGDVQTLSNILKLTDTYIGKGFLFLTITLPSGYTFDRILKILNYFNIYPKRSKLSIYGLAIIWAMHAFYVIFLR